jgi:hypothetical protein
MAELLETVRAYYDEGCHLDVLLICAIPDRPANLTGYWDTEFFEHYQTLFTEAERERIQLAAPIETHLGHRPIHPIPNDVFPYLYNASRGFALFSEEEGQSKVIHEALLCGTPVVVRDTLRGGGRDYLTEENSIQFGTTREARDAFIDIVNDPEAYAFDPSYLRSELAVDETAPKLEAEIKSVYADLGYEYAGEMESTDLAFKLGSHTITLPTELRRGNTNDLQSRRAFLEYVDRLFDDETPLSDRLVVRRADIEQTAAALRREGAVGLAARILNTLDASTELPIKRAASGAFERVGGR